MGLLRAVVKLVDAARKLQSLQISALAGDVRDDVEHFEPYGFTSHPHEGAEALVLPVGGSADHTAALVVADRRHRPRGLSEGEVCLHDDQSQKVHLKRSGIEATTSGTIDLDADGAVSVSGTTIDLTGTTTVTGTLTATGAVLAPSAAVSGGLSAGSLSVDGSTGLTGTYTFAALASGDVQSMTFVGGILTAVVTKP